MNQALVVSTAVVALCLSVTARAADISGQITMRGASAELSRVVVYLDAHPALSGPPPSDNERPQIVQRNKAFVPDLLVVVQGTTVEFPNWDPYSHNVFSRSRAAAFDLDRYGQGQSKSYTFNNAGLVQVFCNIHPQMKALVLVVPNRFVTRCDAQGAFTLRDVPPGAYTLVGWHARGGEGRQTIEVTPQGARGAAIALSSNGTANEVGTSPGRRTYGRGVERGLGVKRERLNLPVVEDAHPAPGTSGRR